VVAYDGRLTPYHKPHSTYVSALHDNPGGDVRFINNLYVSDGNSRQYDRALLPVVMKGNVYTKGSNLPMPPDYFKKYGNLNDSMVAQLKNKHETGGFDKQDFDAAVNLIQNKNSVYLEINFDKSWITQQKRELVTTQSLGKAIIPALPFENADGSDIKVDTDYFGKKRNVSNPSPGPFEIIKSGKQKIQLW
jgi:alpha-N-arabinofuranosidase